MTIFVVMRVNKDIKDYLLARIMFGGNTKEQCHLVKKLREKGEINPWCEDWSIISLPDGADCDEKGTEYPTINKWLIPNDILTND